MSIQSLAQSLQRKIRSEFPLSHLSESSFSIEHFLSSCYSNKSKDVLELSKSLKKDLESFLDSTEKTLSQSISQDFDKILNIPEMMVGIDGEIESLFQESLLVKTNLQIMTESAKGNVDKVVRGIEDLSKSEESFKRKKENEQIDKVLKEFNEKSKMVYEVSQLKVLEKAKVPYGPVVERLAFLIKKVSAFRFVKSSEFMKKRSEFLTWMQKEIIAISIEVDCSDNFESLLQAYSVLGLASEAQMVLRDSVVFPILKSFIPDSNVLLDDTFDIAGFYTSCRKELYEGRLKLFLLHKNVCDVLVKSFWKGLWKSLLTRSKLFSPIFSHDYSNSLIQSVQFLNEICEASEFGTQFRMSADYSEFIEKWNLPTFFELKKTEVIKPLLPLLQSESLNSFCEQGASKVYTNALTTCLSWVIVPELYNKFIRLYFQISSTYCNFITRKLNQQSKSKGNSKEDFILVLNDVDYLRNYIQASYLDQDIKDEIQINLQQIIDPCSRALTEIVTKQCLTHIEGLKTIPSLYRMTGRSMPKYPSAFISEILSPVKGVDFEFISREKIVTKVVLAFIDVVCEVKKEIVKVGDLIGKYNPDSQDKEKMTQQVIIDIEEFKNQLENLGFTSENNEAVKHLVY